MALAIISAPQQDPLWDPVVAIKPYCGAKRTNVVGTYDGSSQTIDADCQIYKAPAPAWADLGVAKHMQSAVVPEDAPRKAVLPQQLKPKFQIGRCLFRFSAVLLSVFENLLCYLAYLQVAPPEESFYNKFEAHMLAYSGIDMVLLVLAVLDTCYLLMFWMMIALVKLDLYSSMAAGRLLLSLPIGGICVALVFFGEGSKVFPFCCAISVMLHFLVLTAERMWPKARKERKVCMTVLLLFWRLLVFLIVGFIVSFIVMFILGSASYLRDPECPATTNKAMPVRIKGIHEWQCAKWGKPHNIRRVTSPGQPIHDALCSTSFHAFTALRNSTDGKQVPSSGAHSVRCPSHCQDLGLGNSVTGCEVYSATSSICSAAVQMGILVANAGGLVKVVGRAPPPSSSGQYKRCNRHGILSTDTSEAASQDYPEWDFYFQVVGMEYLDMVTMHGWRKISTPGTHEPWKSYVVDVTWVVGGTSQRREVGLGPGAVNADIELNFCRGSVSCT